MLCAAPRFARGCVPRAHPVPPPPPRRPREHAPTQAHPHLLAHRPKTKIKIEEPFGILPIEDVLYDVQSEAVALGERQDAVSDLLVANGIACARRASARAGAAGAPGAAGPGAGAGGAEAGGAAVPLRPASPVVGDAVVGRVSR